MKKLYEENIKIHDDQKLSENVFKARITLSVVAILSCITVMVSTAFALFSSNLTQEFTMQAAVWDIVVEATGNGRVSEVYTCPQTEGEMHEFIISPRGTATQGYCIIEITDTKNGTARYCTPAFNDDITVNIQAVAESKITFIPRWGKPDNYDITETFSETIYHSSTQLEESSEEDGETSESTPGEKSGGALSDSFDDTSDETSSDEFEASDSETEFSDSTESSEENTGDSSNESSAADSQESSSSSDGNHSTESNSSSEESSAPVQSSGDSSSSSSDSSSSSGGDSASDSSSSSSESSSSSGNSSSSESSSSSGGGESAPSGDGGSAE